VDLNMCVLLHAYSYVHLGVVRGVKREHMRYYRMQTHIDT